MIAALLQEDPATGRRWLSFQRPPPTNTRAGLLNAGWRYHGGHRAWHHDDPGAQIPAGFAVGRGGACHYSTVRPVRGPAILALLAEARARISSHAPSAA